MTRYKISKYIGSDSMANLICDNYQMLIVMNRFGISLGVGEHSIEQVCEDNGVDTNTFLTVVNLLLNRVDDDSLTDEAISVKELINYLLNSHRYYTEYRLPAIRAKLIEAVGEDEISTLLISYFDNYTQKICDHLSYEEQVVFPYVNKLCDGQTQQDYSIEVFIRSHDHIDEPLDELKNIIIKYYHSDSHNDIIMVLHDILSCSNDLSTHNMVENYLLVPVIKHMEQHGR